MKTPQVKPDWEVGIWNARVIMTDQTEEPETEPRCPQCGATSRWGVLGDSPHEEDCDFCKSVFG